MLENLNSYRIILASKSPRRQALLKGLDIDFEIKTKDISEEYSSDIPAKDVPAFLAEKKANAFDDILKENDLLITSDTIVIQGKEILEKPQSEEHAIEMISKLSGNTHTVVTGVHIRSNKKRKTFSNQTTVYFSELTQEEITYYVKKYKPYDKAGAYGVQEWIGYIGIKRLEGSYYNVMGLPLDELYQELKHF